MLKEYLSTLANKFRSVLGGTEKINAQDFVDKIQDVYGKGDIDGWNRGMQEGYDYGLTEGKQAEYDEFWDAFQQNGKYMRQEYRYSGAAWNDTNFKPKYNINATNVDHIFYGTAITNLAQILKERGLKLDVSQANNHAYAYAGCNVTHFPTIDLSIATITNGLFSYNNYMVEIKKLIVSENTTLNSDAFQNSPVLETVIFEGVWAKNGLNFQWLPKLTIESMRSLISCLKDYSADTSGASWVVTVGSTNLAKLTDSDLENISAKGWQFK